MTDSFQNGFVKRAQEYGMDQKAAITLFNEKAASISHAISGGAGDILQKLIGPDRSLIHSENGQLASMLGMTGLGGLVGAGAGAMGAGHDEHGKKKWFSGGLKGALLGGGVGLAGGAGVAGAIGANPNTYSIHSIDTAMRQMGSQIPEQISKQLDRFR